MYTANDVCAGIVFFNGGEIVVKNIEAIRNQVRMLVIIDNGSDDDKISLLDQFKSDSKINVIHNNKNRGIGYALNQILEYAVQNHMPLMLTMDQDTVLSENAVKEMVRIINEDADVAAVGASYLEGQENQTQRVKYLITSGNLVDVQKAVRAGGYNSELFIDSVDIDFSLKLRDEGYKLISAGHATMQHAIGEKEEGRILFFKIPYMGHSASRYYYIYRNHIYIFKTYGKKYFGFCLKMFLVLLFDTAKLIMLENDRKSKIGCAVKGIKDGIRKWN